VLGANTETRAAREKGETTYQEGIEKGRGESRGGAFKKLLGKGERREAFRGYQTTGRKGRNLSTLFDGRVGKDVSTSFPTCINNVNRIGPDHGVRRKGKIGRVGWLEVIFNSVVKRRRKLTFRGAARLRIKIYSSVNQRGEARGLQQPKGKSGILPRKSEKHDK